MRALVTAAAMLALAGVGTSLAVAGSGSNVAPCEKAMIGHGSPGWRGESLTAGPLGVRRHPLNQMSREGSGLTTKMPMLIEGREPQTVTVSVPPSLRQRVFLYYGTIRDRDGNLTTSFRAPGYSETEFQLCGNKPRTIWPGGVRIHGTRPVRLLVNVEDRAAPFVLRLGRPMVYQPR